MSLSDQRINIDGQEVEHVEEFVFLGSVIPDSSADIERRIALASAAFGRLKETIWKKRIISEPLKVRLYNAVIRKHGPSKQRTLAGWKLSKCVA